MIHIDGSFGEGGGQVLRSSLALSMITGKPFTVENIRANRPKPGLLRQHLTAVRAAAEVCNGTADKAALGSTSLTFTPGAVRGGDYSFAIGTAGSTTLVLQTVLPALMIADEPSTLEISGGTHNTNSPTAHFLSKAFLPIIERMGPKVTVELDRHGFYPAGGGLIRVRIDPAKTLRSFELLDRGEPVHKEAIAMVADLATDIAVRELACVKSKLAWQDDELRIERLDTGVGPGNVLSVELAHEHICEVFTGFGERNVSANRIANKAAADVRRYIASGVPVWEHLADQLLLPIAMAGGGGFRTCALTPHTQTNIAVVEQFLDVRFTVCEQEDKSVVVSL